VKAVKRFDRIQIDYRLTFATPFHCGTGTRIGLIDRTVVRDSEDYLYVPGSTIKGVAREHCEQLARLYEDLDERMHDLIGSPHDKENALHSFGDTITMVTRIFGSSIQPGTLFFDDARQDDEQKKQYDSDDPYDGEKRYQNMQVDTYTQVRLDRPTRTAVQGALYTSEFGVRDILLEGRILGGLACTTVDTDDPDHAFFATFTDANRPTYSLLLLLAGLSMLERLGGNKSTGKGQCRCDITSVHVNGTKEEHWQRWLEHLDVLGYYALSQEERG